MSTCVSMQKLGSKTTWRRTWHMMDGTSLEAFLTPTTHFQSGVRGRARFAWRKAKCSTDCKPRNHACTCLHSLT
jgi:hypothetical protein